LAEKELPLKKQILLGTINQAKIAHLQEACESLPIEVLSSRDLNIEITVEEDGKSAEEF
jgi:inosine/xanthosine triphosphate pyrophosphatase family protein